MAFFRRALSVSKACRRWCSSSVADLTAPECVYSLVKLDEKFRTRGGAPKALSANKEDDREVIELISSACKLRDDLRPEQFANLLIVLSDRFVYENDDVAKQLTDHGVSILRHYSAEDVIELCSATVKPVQFTEFVRLAGLHALQRASELEDPGNDLLSLWKCAVQKDLALVEVLEGTLDALVAQCVTLTPEQLSGFVNSCGKLPHELIPQALSKLAPTVVSSMSTQTPANTLCDVAYMYGTSVNSTNKGFWRVLLPLLTSKLSQCEPHAVVNAAFGVASSQHLERVEKGVFLKRLAEPIIGKMHLFSVDEMTQLMEAFVKSHCTHKVLFCDLRQTLKRQVHYKTSVLDVPRILFSMTRLRQPNKELLDHCLEKLDGKLLQRLPTQNIPLLLYSMADMKLKPKHIPEHFLPAVVDIVTAKWKSIPKDDFKLIAGCIDKLGYESRDFDTHKVMRLGNDASSTVALMNKWKKRDEKAEVLKFNLMIHEDRLIRHTVKHEKRRLNVQRDDKSNAYLAHAVATSVNVNTLEQTQDARDSDAINVWHRDDANGMAMALLESSYFRRIMHQYKPPANKNPLPYNGVEPHGLGRIRYHAASNSSDSPPA